MARVDDGTLLQHFTACHLGERLAATGEGTLRLVATHAGAPFGPTRNVVAHEHDARLRRRFAEPVGEVAVLRAYAATRASFEHVPDTTELLAALLGRTRLAGVLCATAPEARLALEDAWRATAVHVEGRGWREALADGALFPREDLDRPWLVAMDTLGWLHDGEAKKEARGAHLVRDDLEALRPLLAAHVKSGQPGAVAAFAPGADASHAKGFRSHALRLADRLGLERAVLGIDASDATRHLGIVMSSCEDLAAGAAEAWHAFLAEG